MTPSSGNVLVVDDQEFLRDLLARYLKDLKHTVTLAGNGRQALDLLRAHKFDLVLLDIMMPVMSGFEVLAELKGDPQLSDIPVIVISADTEIESIITCIKHGAEDYLFKPYNSVLLNARVNACLDKNACANKNAPTSRRLSSAWPSALRWPSGFSPLRALWKAAFRRQTTVLQSILDSMGDGVVVVDTAGALVHQNPAARHTAGRPAGGFLPSVGHPLKISLCGSGSRSYRPDELPLAQAIHGRSIDSAEISSPHRLHMSPASGLASRPARCANDVPGWRGRVSRYQRR
ncbi:MAG: response regulator [Kouleothrix sp.]